MINIPAYLVGGCWIIFIAYWFISARSVKPTQQVQSGLWKFRGIVILVFAVIITLYRLLGLNGCKIDASGCHYYLLTLPNKEPIAIQYLATLLSIIGLIIAVIARRQLADNWSASVELKKGHELITTGIYGLVRHPIYAGMLLMSLGAATFINAVVFWVILIVVVVLFGYRAKQEEALMTKTFPKEYPEYKKKVKALIPFIF